jgi:PII-like signaling protein
MTLVSGVCDMQLYRKKKVEIFVEAACVPRIIDMIETVGATGYTVLPKVSGKGNRGVRNDGHLTDVFRNICIIVIAAEDIARRIVAESQPLLENYAGIVAMSDVEVVRDDHF